jgi:hypothetical protein
MNKRISSKQALAVLLTVIIVILGYLAYVAINDKVENTFFYVVLDSDGGTRYEPLKVRINEPAEKPEDPEKEGYKFKYWSLDNKEYDFSTKVRGNIKLRAIWEKEEDKDKK